MMVLPFALVLIGLLAVGFNQRSVALSAWAAALGWQLWLFHLHATDKLPFSF